ncbi:D-serine ammonia-lyase [Rummeliibacillus suwonensis]|uniref:D-serine ammonia-lyase n=1 Tax=Rummeliibacillus suwonensis TaxID=1306154 RepID=UPI0011B5335B|nr:D-serine ammonia-lyase [Rummeliibacillus suwonensis]
MDLSPFQNLIDELKSKKMIVWKNKKKSEIYQIDSALIDDAEGRLKRFAPYFQEVFPETKKQDGKVESVLQSVPVMQQKLGVKGKLYVKRDDALPISGSIKARGGIHEVLYAAEKIAMEHRFVRLEDNYKIFTIKPIQKLLSQYTIVVGSTGNLGLSIGIMSATLGFKVNVHMSHDAKEWKKQLLRKIGVTVVEHSGDFSLAVDAGRKEALKDPNSYFIDDEHSKQLFAGYAVAGRRLKQQLQEENIAVDANHPLYVYIPCGVGGGPGGVTYGLKESFGENVHGYFVEPIESPCMLLGMATGLHDKIAVQDIGLSNLTIADGLAVGRPSSFVGQQMEPLLDGIMTISDERLSQYVRTLYQMEKIIVEPSAVAGFIGLEQLKDATDNPNATHIVWATGGSMVPKDEQQKYILG